MKQAKTTKREILSENSTHIYYKDGTVKIKSDTTKQPLEDSKELISNGDLKFHIEKHLRVDCIDLKKDEYEDEGEMRYVIDVNEDSYFYADRDERNSDFENLKDIFKDKSWLDDSRPEKPTPDSKEGLHTQGEWYVDTNKAGDYTQIKAQPNKFICELDGREKAYQNEANAELIVKAVNERKALLDSHRELLDALEMVRKHYNEVDENGYIHGSTPEFRNKIETAINNAKNI